LWLDPDYYASPGKVVDAFEVALEVAITNGELQTALDQVAPNSYVYIVTGRTANDENILTTNNINSSDNNGTDADGGVELSDGAIAGFAAVGAIGLAFLTLLLVRRRNHHQYHKKQHREFCLKECCGDDNNNNDLESPTTTLPESDRAVTPPARSSKQVTRAAVPPWSFHEPKKAPSPVPPSSNDDNNDVVADDDSSHAGSSGWSSHGGESSDDDESSDGVMLGSTPNINKTKMKKQQGAAAPQNSFTELDQAIQKGDWAAVGVTAALLASQPFEKNKKQKQQQGGTSLFRQKNKAAAAAAQSPEEDLDRLVKLGDWDAIVAAATKLSNSEARETMSMTTRSDQSVSSRGSATVSTGTGRSALTSVVTTASEAQAREQRLDEIRLEVDELIQQVVPEERTHIDEMLIHFHGNEEVLLETLRTMKERSVAQKARSESQQLAKQKIKSQNQQQRRFFQGVVGAVDNTGTPADEQWMSEIEKVVKSEAAEKSK
jgi:hypothetical protein